MDNSVLEDFLIHFLFSALFLLFPFIVDLKEKNGETTFSGRPACRMTTAVRTRTFPKLPCV